MKWKQIEDSLKRLDNIIEKVFMCFMWVAGVWLILPLEIIAFIFWRNKYAERYWEKKKEWRKMKRKLRLKARKETIVSTVLPKIKEYGFEPKPFTWWGWCGMIHAYSYTAVRLEGNELRFFDIVAFSNEKRIIIESNIYTLDPITVNNVSEIGEYTYLLVSDGKKRCKTMQTHYFYLKNFRSKKQLENRSIPKLKRQFEKVLSDITVFNKTFYGDFYTKLTPETVDLLEEKAYCEKATRRQEEEKRKSEQRRQRRKELKEQRERAALNKTD